MARILAIDYGKKRTGIAVSDPLQIIASGLTTVASDQLIWFLKDYFRREAVEVIVLGYPLHLNGTPNDITAKVEKLAGQLRKIFSDKEITLADERFTSKIAERTIRESGLKKTDRRNKALIDEVSATILLQDYLQTR